MRDDLPYVIALLATSFIATKVAAQIPREGATTQQQADATGVRKRTIGSALENVSRIERPVAKSQIEMIADRQTPVNDRSQSAGGNHSFGPFARVLPSTAPARTSAVVRASSFAAAGSVYRTGIGDVLDIRMSNFPGQESTLYTILKNGTIEHPLLSGPIAVAGLTADEIGGLLSREIKVIQSPRVSVTVRDYASHIVTVTGDVDSPGRKVLRRESMPLYAVLATALMRSKAETAIIERAGKEIAEISLTDNQAMATLVRHGDVVRIVGESARRFFYISGKVIYPGEKSFREGMTLTQAVIAAGGSPSEETLVKVIRRDENGFLHTREYNMLEIVKGQLPDPLAFPGDRIEVIPTSSTSRTNKPSQLLQRKF